MRLYQVKGSSRPLLLSEEHAELIGAAEVQERPAPAKSASRQEWADYAASLGAVPESLETLTRAQLIDTYGS